MACPALPLCGLAITEAERGLPDINRCVVVSHGVLCMGVLRMARVCTCWDTSPFACTVDALCFCSLGAMSLHVSRHPSGRGVLQGPFGRVQQLVMLLAKPCICMTYMPLSVDAL